MYFDAAMAEDYKALSFRRLVMRLLVAATAALFLIPLGALRAQTTDPRVVEALGTYKM